MLLIVLKAPVQRVSLSSRLTTEASATEAAIHQKKFGSCASPSDLVKWTTLIISNEEMNDTMKIVKSPKGLSLLIKGVSKTIKMKQKNKNEDFLECF